MQLDAATKAKYEKEAPELLDAVTSGEAEFIMRRDPSTDYCVKFDQGWCGVHKQYGSDFLGDACHFYPRVTRALGNMHTMTGTMSCPEIVRLMIEQEAPFDMVDSDVERIPASIKDYLPAGLSERDALAIHRQFLDAVGDELVSVERALSRIASVSRSLQVLSIDSWPAAVPFYLGSADARLLPAEPAPVDPFNLLHALCGLVSAAKKTNRERLMETIREMEEMLHVTLDWRSVSISLSSSSPSMAKHLELSYIHTWKKSLQPILRKWAMAQLSVALYPFSGFGDTLAERMTTLMVRFALVKLAITSGCVKYGSLQSEVVIRAIQSLSRFLDHLADPALTLSICKETGWDREGRQRGLIGDA